MTIHAAFPFDVVGHYTTTVFASALEIEPLEWGAHGGPFVALPQGSGRWKLHALGVPAAATGVLTDTVTEVQEPPEHEDVMSGLYSLPGNRSLFAYTDETAGTAYLYTGTQNTSVAAIEGLSSMQGYAHNSLSRYLYTASSPFVGGLDAPGNARLFAQNLCPSDALVDSDCAPFPLIDFGPGRTTTGMRVAVDATGNVAVVAEGTGTSPTTEVRALTHCQASGETTITTSVLHTYPQLAAFSLALLPPGVGGLDGYLVETGMDAELGETAPIATPIRAEGAGFVVAGPDIVGALTQTDTSTGRLTVLGAHEGYLWLHVVASDGDHVFKLRRRVTGP